MKGALFMREIGMTLRNSLFAALAVCAATSSAAPKLNLSIPTVRKNAIIPGQILVKLKVGQVDALMRDQEMKYNIGSGLLGSGSFLSRIGQSGWTLWSVPSDTDTKALSETISENVSGVLAEPVYRIYPMLSVPNDPDFNFFESDPNLILVIGEEDPIPFRRCWNLEDTDAFAGWSNWPNQWYTQANKPRTAPTIAVIDTGCDLSHPDFINAGGNTSNSALGGQIDWARCAQFHFGEIDPFGDPNDAHGHGTHVSGLALASGNNGGFNGQGMIGIGYNSRGMILRVFDDQGTGSDADAASAIYYAADSGAEIINLSIGTEAFSQAFQDACTYAFQKGCLIIAAGNEDGNGGGDLGPIYPAACSGVIGVTANGPGLLPATSTYAGFGYYADIAAPGGDLTFDGNQYNVQFVWSTAMRSPGSLYNNPNLYPPYTLNYAYLAGTSMACPQVSGAASLFYGKQNIRQGSWNNIRALRALESSAYSVFGAPYGSWEPYQGYGCLDVASLMQGVITRNAQVGSVEGIVYINSIATSNVPIRAKKGTVTITTNTRLDGTYRFDSLAPGVWTLTMPAAGAGLQPTIRNVLVKLGSDTPATDFWANGTFNFDDTPPVVNQLRVGSTSTTVSGNHWANDLESGVDKMTFKIGTTLGASNVMAETEVYPGSDTTSVDPTSFKFTGLSIVRKQRYFLRAVYRNGAGLTTTKNIMFLGGLSQIGHI